MPPLTTLVVAMLGGATGVLVAHACITFVRYRLARKRLQRERDLMQAFVSIHDSFRPEFERNDRRPS